MVKKGNKPVIWFERKDYEAIKRLMPNEPYLCDTFEQWLDKASKNAEKLHTLGFVVRKSIIDHEQFAAYCAKTGQDRQSSGRAARLRPTPAHVQKTP